MAIESTQGFGIFSPASAYRRGPTAERAAIEGEALSKASYLVAIDQVNLQLELEREKLAQQQAQFETTFGLEEKKFGLMEEQFEFQKGESEKYYDYLGRKLGLEERGLGIQEMGVKGDISYKKGLLDLQEQQQQLTGDIYSSIIDLAQQRARSPYPSLIAPSGSTYGAGKVFKNTGSLANRPTAAYGYQYDPTTGGMSQYQIY